MIEVDETQDGAALVLREVRLRLKRRLAFLSWIAERAGQASESLVHVLSDETDAESERDWCAKTPELATLNRAIDTLETRSNAPEGRLRALVDCFGLCSNEVCALKAAVALCLDPNLRRALSALDGQGGRHELNLSHVAQLFGVAPFVLSPMGAALRWRLIDGSHTVGEPNASTLADPAIVSWLAGAKLEDAALATVATQVTVRDALPEWPVTRALAYLDGATGPLRLRISGVTGSGRKTFAAVLAERSKRQLLLVDVTTTGSSSSAMDAEQRATQSTQWLKACRRARLCGELLAWCGALPVGVDTEGGFAPERYLWITTAHDETKATSNVASPLIELPLPEPDTRRRLWLGALPAANVWPAAELEQLVLMHRVTPAEIAAVSAIGIGSAGEASKAVRETGRGVLAGLAQRLEVNFTFDDLMASVPVKSALDDLLFEARERLAVWEDPKLKRLFPLGTGLMALFCGPPGTGKTMSAQILARELGLDLYRIDLSMIVSKYVGETTKNLDRVLSSAARMDVVLFFDEADSLFGKRTDIRDAHDRYANTDTNYLLQAVEAYKGIALLATNRKGNIDGAFLRRLRHVIDFPAPDAGQRLELWTNLVKAIAGEQAEVETGPVLPILATSFELSGAQIKYAVLHSLYSSRKEKRAMQIKHLIGGVERELQKLGRGISRGEAQRLLTFDKGLRS